MKEKPKRSIAKTITYRISTILITALIVFLFTENLKISLVVGGIDTVAKTFWYYTHERMWSRIK